MGVGHHDDILARGAQGVKKIDAIRTYRDLVTDFVLEFDDIDFEHFAPVIGRVPVKAAFYLPGLGNDMLLRGLRLHALDLGITQRQVFLPEIIIEMQVE